jgi:hypothetical protein
MDVFDLRILRLADVRLDRAGLRIGLVSVVAPQKHERLSDAFGDDTAEGSPVHVDVRPAPRIVVAELQGCGTTERVAEDSDSLHIEPNRLHVGQSAWRGKLQTPKTKNAFRMLPLSPQLSEHLREFLDQWRPNEKRLLFAQRNALGCKFAGQEKAASAVAISCDSSTAGCMPFGTRTALSWIGLGAPLKVRPQRLGHSDPRLTLGIYTHVVSEDDERIAARCFPEFLAQTCPSCKKWWLAV